MFMSETRLFALNTEWAQVEVIDLINDGSGLAFGIIGGRSTGVVVKTILPGGVADRDGRLQSGDHILQIGEVNLRGLGSEQVASVLRQCGVHVRMVVARPVESTSADYQALGSHAPIVPTKILGDPVELDRHLIENGYVDAFAPPPSTAYSTPFIYTGQQSDIQLHPISGIVDVVRDPLPIGAIPSTMSLPVTTVSYLPLDMALREPSLPETETFTVELKKDDLGLGITVAGYVCEKEEISGIFVKSVSKGSAADVNRKIKVNDRIVEVDGKSVIGCNNHQAVEMLRNTGSVVTITFERYLRGPKYEQLQQAIKANELRPPSPPSPTISSLPKVPLSLVKMSSSVIEAEGESRTSMDFDSAVLLDVPTPTNEEVEIVIGAIRKSVQFSIASHESIYDKWRERLSIDVEIVIAQMHKEPSSGLGISLEGTVDVEDGQEVRPHHYIRNILPDGPVGRNGVLQSGDELLEVNGIQLMGLNHLEVVSILKQLPNFVSLVCARCPVPTRIIDTAQHRDAFEARNILAESLQTLIPSDRMVKAKSDTSIVSSVASDVCCASGIGSRSRSLELIAGLPMWSDEPTIVELVKGDHGLGFSILDYQDPLNPQETVIVIRSLIPGGVAQTDGQLIPGDRLIAVNDVNVANANLDQAVQVLKGAPKGLVKIAVAKPLSLHDNYSHNSQCVRKLLREWSEQLATLYPDTEDDQTCLDDFQECLEEYQECLDVVQICIDDETSFNHSPCSSQFDYFDDTAKNNQNNCKSDDFLENCNNNNTKTVQPCTDPNHHSTNETKSDVVLRNNNCVTLTKNDSSTQSDKLLTEVSEKDGYETCIDESFSEDICAKISRLPVQNVVLNSSSDNKEDVTPTNSKSNLANQNFLSLAEDANVSTALSEPCLNHQTFSKHKHLCLDSKRDDELKSYDNQDSSLGGDEFFLVQFPVGEVAKFRSEPNVLDMYERPKPRPKFYRKCLVEYYNDYADCLEAYQVYSQESVKNEEMKDECIFNNIVLPTKSRSAPDIRDSSFVMLTYDPGPDRARRKSAFVAGYQGEHESEAFSMTVIRPPESCCTGAQVGSMLQKHWGSIRTVRVYREPNTSLGISIVGGKVDLHTSNSSPETILGIFVKNVVDNSPAGRTGQFKTGDRILEVSGIDLRHASHERAVDAIKKAPNPVTFMVQSIVPVIADNETVSGGNHKNDTSVNAEAPPVQFTSNQGARNDSRKKSVKIQENSTEKIHEPETVVNNDVGAKKYESSDESDDEEDVRDLEGRTVSAKGQEIDRASAANMKRTKEEVAADPEQEDDFGYTMTGDGSGLDHNSHGNMETIAEDQETEYELDKVKKKYASLGHSILMVQLERSGQGLGLSLAGHKDRNCMAVFVCGINPTGVAYKTGGIQVGDEILEVNGVVLHGRCHLNASAIIKGLSGPIFKVIILRRKTAIDDIAVKPITQFPVSLAEEGSEEHFSNYPNVRTVTIKKGTQSLGIMIIEGKHAEVGQGIFISDIQEGSSAEKAGLEIGEMILAVNKDTLLGSNYDAAANLLKRTEGLVSLVVSNPGKKASTPVPGDGDKNSINRSTLKATGGPPSRPATPVPEPPADPATCPITPGKEVTIEIITDNKSLGINFAGGKDTLIPNGIVLVEVYLGGTADKDGRLQPGDQILDVNGTSLKDVTHSTALQSLRQTLPKMKLIVFRPEKADFTPIDVDLVKKPGKGLGLSVIARKSGKGIYVAEIINGGVADVDGRIMKGDLLVSVNGQSVECSSGEEAGAVLKTVTGKVSLKLHRYKPTAR